MLTSADPLQGGAIGTFTWDGLDPAKLTAHLWSKWRVIVTPIVHAQFVGVRVTPTVYTTLADLDTFVKAVASFPR